MDMDTDTQTRWKSQRGVDGEAWKRSGKKMGATVAVGGLGEEEGGGEDNGAAQQWKGRGSRHDASETSSSDQKAGGA